MHEGKRYRRVQIEGTEEEFLMDDEQNIYDMNLKQVGKAGDIAIAAGAKEAISAIMAWMNTPQSE